MKQFIAVAAIALSTLSATGYEEIRDESGLIWKNPDLKERTSCKIRLSNGLEAFIISDPKADQSSAAVAVEVGSWSDPSEYPGMAHFCEHLLFLGSEKYPDPKGFSHFLSDHGGDRNAFTGADRTVYTFSCETEPFIEALDRFSRFFIDPLFAPSHISRELHAVDQEFAKNLESDAWRIHMVAKEQAGPGHPHSQFNIGNSETLAKIPQTVFRAWHKEHYTAGRIRLFVYSSLPLQELKETISRLFSEVPAGKLERPDLPNHLTGKEMEGKITYIEPIQDISRINLSWELPGKFAHDETESAYLIAHVLKRGQDKGLYELLQRKRYIDSMSVQVDEMGGKYPFFEIDLHLTELGLQNKEEVITHCFEAISLLKNSRIPSYLFDECYLQDLQKYEYQERKEAYDMASSIGEILLDEPISTFPRKTILASHFSPEKIGEILSHLTPENCCYTLAAPSKLTGVSMEKKEKWFGTEYAVKEIDPRQLRAWKTVRPNPDIALPGPNPFLATKLEPKPTKDHYTTPIILAETQNSLVYYYRGAEFSAPTGSIHLHIGSTNLQPNAKSSVLTSLYLDHLTDQIRPILSAARSAGLTASFKLERLKLHIQIDGFSEKAPLLLEEILREMTVNPPTREQFEIYKARHEKGYRNSEKTLPVSQSNQLLSSLLFEGRTTDAQKLAALQTIELEDLVQFHQTLFKKSYMEALFAGNFSFEEIEKHWSSIQKKMKYGIYLREDRPSLRVLHNQAQPTVVKKVSGSQGCATTLAIDLGPLTLEKKAAQELLGPILKEAFFHELRTRQKTGYIVDTSPQEFENHLFQVFLVQSNSHMPEELLYRFEHFLEEFLETMDEEISDERLERVRESAIQSLKNRFRSIAEKGALWNFLAFEKGADFDYVAKRIRALQAISRTQLQQIAREMFSRSNKKRLAVLCSGRMENPFLYTARDGS